MTRSTFRFAAVILIACGGFAAAPWKTMHNSTIDGYSERMEVALSSVDRDVADPLNCTDACATKSIEGGGVAATDVARDDGASLYADLPSTAATTR